MRLSVTTPQGSLVDTDVDEITAPGVLGELGVLPGHVPLLSGLRAGVLVFVSKGKGHSGTLAVGEGFLEVAPGEGGDRVLVLVDQAVSASAVDRAGAEREVAELDAQLAAWKRELDGEYHALLSRRDWASARADAAARIAAH